jgi:NADP-dependent aldehyde dehydrogenase
MTMTDTPFPHLIAGKWLTGGAIGAQVDTACRAAQGAFASFGWSSAQDRAGLLHAIADAIEARADAITAIATQETALPAGRIQGERGRTTGQLRLFADHILTPTPWEVRHDPALPDRHPLPRPDLRMVQRPVGPVAVFGASNFPLAFSTAGGDTTAALAAGCPVVVKGHPAHPGTTHIVAEAILEAIQKTGFDPAIFNLVQDGSAESGAALVQHPAIQAVGFTGSHRVGRILFDLCAARAKPIPFFGELGAVNPVFVLPGALDTAEALGAAWAGSLTMGVGQFCTNPGLLVLPEGDGATRFLEAALSALAQVAPQDMLTAGIASACRAGAAHLAQAPGVTTLLAPKGEGRTQSPGIFEASPATVMANPHLREEVFGPIAIITRADAAQMLDLAQTLDGQLTATIHMTGADTDTARALLPVLEQKAGRVLFNGFPTGVEVASAMVHGGPYPASTNFGATSVGTLSIRRFLRPVCYQNLPSALMASVPNLAP